MAPKDFIVDIPWLYQAEIIFVDWLGYIAYTVITLYILGIIFSITHLKALYTTYMAMNFFVKILLGAYLVYRFNTFRQYKVYVTELDRKVIYSASLYIVIVSFLDLYQPEVNKLLAKLEIKNQATSFATSTDTSTANSTATSTATTIQPHFEPTTTSVVS
jgi:membrane-bound ClpP family serine protease